MIVTHISKRGSTAYLNVGEPHAITGFAPCFSCVVQLRAAFFFPPVQQGPCSKGFSAQFNLCFGSFHTSYSVQGFKSAGIVNLLVILCDRLW